MASTGLPEILWLEPAPASLLGPDATMEAREKVQLAFITALQQLPPMQRAAVLLADVLEWPVGEIAALLESTPAAINSALQRARATLDGTPLKKVPLLVLADGWKIPESTIIVEYLDSHFSTGTRLIPDDKDQARQTRFHDRIADLYVTEPLMNLIFKRGDATASHTRLDDMMTGLDEHIAKRTWIMGDAFTLADCSLAPALRYAKELHPFDRYKNVLAYFGRLLERPSVQGVFADMAAQLAA